MPSPPAGKQPRNSQVGPKLKASVPSRQRGGATILEERMPTNGQLRTLPSGAPTVPVAVAYIARGRANMTTGKTTALLEPGSLMVWTLRQPWSLTALEPVLKYTFLFREEDVRSWPAMVERRGLPIAPASPIGAVLSGFFEELIRQLDALPTKFVEVAITMARELLSRALCAEYTTSSRTPGDQVFQRVLEHVDRRLGDPTLSPETLARTQGISLRYLHLLFSRKGLQVASWIRQKRLETCRSEIAIAPATVTITSIALKWGFNDSSHFSRLFSHAFGISPSNYRRKVRLNVGDEVSAGHS
jgi:AraC family transcriptional regulator, positive regulator of tynA and feaB